MRAVILAGAVVALAAQPAGAATLAGYNSQSYPVVVALAKSGRSITLARTALDIKCSDGTEDYLPDAWKQVPIGSSGKFAAVLTNRSGTNADGRPTRFDVALRGRYDRRRGRMTGTWSLTQRVRQRNGSTVTCRSGTVRFTLGTRGRRRPLTQGYYGAFSSNDYPVVAQVARNGRSVAKIRGSFELKCSRGGYRFVGDGWTRLAIRAKGRFGARVTRAEQEFGDGSAFTVDSAVSGTISSNGRRLTGVWRLRWYIPEADGVTDICDSGNVRFSVKR